MDVFPRDKILKLLRTGELDLHGQFLLGSNYTLLVQVTSGENQLIAVHKPEQGERPLWDFPYGSLEKREVAAYLVSEALGWDLVPPVVYREEGPFGPGSVQLYVEHDPDYHYFNFDDSDVARLRPAAVFDLIINNADRKGGHIIKDPEGHLWLIDHGLCFHEQDKLRTVLWDFAGERIPDRMLTDIARLHDALAAGDAVRGELAKLLLPEEISAISNRADRILRSRIFPMPDENQRQFPWPPV